MSAISSFVRDNARAVPRSLLAGLQVQLLQGFKWAGRITDHFCGDFGVLGGSRQLSMAQQHLDHPYIRARFQQMGVAKLCRSVCNVAGLLSPAMRLADVNARLSWRGEIGLIFGLPGNSQPSGRASH